MQIEINDNFVMELLEILEETQEKHKDVIRNLRLKNDEGDYDVFIEANSDYIAEIGFITSQLKGYV